MLFAVQEPTRQSLRKNAPQRSRIREEVIVSNNSAPDCTFNHSDLTWNAFAIQIVYYRQSVYHVEFFVDHFLAAFYFFSD
jgi:hypothetical protein